MRNMKQIIIDVTDIMENSVGKQGISQQQMAQMEQEIKQAHQEMTQEDHFFRHLPQADISELLTYGQHIKDNFDNFLLLGIGGSALGPEAIFKSTSNTFHNQYTREKRSAPRCFFEDNVDPDRMHDVLEMLDLKQTCVNVISKSGKTIETLSQFMIVLERLQKECPQDWQSHLVITTDKTQGFLRKFAQQHHIKTFEIPEQVGGRYSIFTPVGILTGAVCGCDVVSLLQGASDMNRRCDQEDYRQNPAYLYALAQVLLMRQGKNIAVMMPYADCLKYISDWFSQLWAESLGKAVNTRGEVIHAGQTPVRALGSVDQHSQLQLYAQGPYDKVITFIGMEQFRHQMDIPKILQAEDEVAFLGGKSLNQLISSELRAIAHTLSEQGRPNITITLPDSGEYCLGQLFMMLQIATVFAGFLLGVNPFDQPGVEEGKISTYALMGKPEFAQRKKELEDNKQERFLI